MLSEKQEKKAKIDVVVLLAGEGRRMRPLTNDRPKGLLCSENGISIFSNLVNVFAGLNWDVTIIPVIGHGMEKVHEEINNLRGFVKFKCAYNPFYKNTGPLVSLWLGLMKSTSNSVVIVNGDTLIRDSLVNKIATWMYSKNRQDKPRLGMCISVTDCFYNDDLKVLLNGEGSFIKVGKNIIPSSNCVKSAGVICIKSYNDKKIIQDMLDELIMDGNSINKNYYWHNLINLLNGMIQIDLIEVDLHSWHEVDTIDDLKLIGRLSSYKMKIGTAK